MPKLAVLLPGLCLAAALACVTPAHGQGSCGPSMLGNPCATGGVATQGAAEPGLNLGAGNPVNLVTGNKYQQEVDLPADAAAPLLEVVRHYNAQDPRSGTLGRGWSFSYDTRLYLVAGRAQILQADGSRITFEPGPWPRLNRHGELRPEGTNWIWVWPGGRSLHFDAQGWLIRIEQPGAGALEVLRHAQTGPLRGAIDQVRAGAGMRLTFHYRQHNGEARVTAIDSPRGTLRYDYDGPDAQSAQRLVRVSHPMGTQRHYLYEAALQAGNVSLLTGIASTAAGRPGMRRLAYWRYDARARVIETGRHDDARSTLHIEYRRPPRPDGTGLTVVRNADGGRTFFHTALWGDRYSLLRVQGQPCDGCAAPGSRFQPGPQGGRQLTLPGADIQLHAQGQVARITTPEPGWPGLALHYDTRGRRVAWHSRLTGGEHMSYDEQHRPVLRRFANGDRWTWRYDALGRLIRLQARNAQDAVTTTLTWRDGMLAAVDHPNERVALAYDSQGRLAAHTVQRPASHAIAQHAHRQGLTDRFEYDGQGRLATHHLPEGGSLHFSWSAAGRLMRIDWRDRTGRPHLVLDSPAPYAGYHHGNGLWMHTLHNAGRVRMLTLRDGARPVWLHHMTLDGQGRVAYDRLATAGRSWPQTWRYIYDAQDRLQAARLNSDAHHARRAGTRLVYRWGPMGDALSATAQATAAHRDASGLPQAFAGLSLRYGPGRRLEQVSRQGQLLATYRHNAMGYRIAARHAQGGADYYYLGHRLVAQSSGPHAAHVAAGITQRYIHAGQVPVGMIVYTRARPQGELYALHTDLIGALRLVTDAGRRIRWQADYTPTGAAQGYGEPAPALRLPGQIHDAATGWHDNLLRTYSPQAGQYLEPDPLGPMPGGQALGYAGQQPRRYVDPLGLLLFAFDGTRYAARNRSNVWLMSQRYADGDAHYHSGPGNPYYIDWDAAVAHSAPTILENQWQWLLNGLQRNPVQSGRTVPIDIIGYSRGAALARHFANQIEQHVTDGLFSYTDSRRGLITACVDLRFMGLFDTVAQFGLYGADNALYDLSIAAGWRWVAHAVALHERRWMMPLTTAAEGAPANVVEAPFVGAHADIGGGVAVSRGAPDPDEAGDLSDVALNWMLWQARTASVRMRAGDAAQQTVTRPILHDERSVLARAVLDSDRRIDAAGGARLHARQDDHERLGRLPRSQTESLIQRAAGWRTSSSSAVGLVDMEGYARWLSDTLGWDRPPR